MRETESNLITFQYYTPSPPAVVSCTGMNGIRERVADGGLSKLDVVFVLNAKENVDFELRVS